MAEIIPLESRRRQATAAIAPRPDKPATIVIFPGVRYEKPQGDGATNPASSRRRPPKAN